MTEGASQPNASTSNYDNEMNGSLSDLFANEENEPVDVFMSSLQELLDGDGFLDSREDFKKVCEKMQDSFFHSSFIAGDEVECDFDNSISDLASSFSEIVDKKRVFSPKECVTLKSEVERLRRLRKRILESQEYNPDFSGFPKTPHSQKARNSQLETMDLGKRKEDLADLLDNALEMWKEEELPPKRKVEKQRQQEYEDQKSSIGLPLSPRKPSRGRSPTKFRGEKDEQRHRSRSRKREKSRSKSRTRKDGEETAARHRHGSRSRSRQREEKRKRSLSRSKREGKRPQSAPRSTQRDERRNRSLSPSKRGNESRRPSVSYSTHERRRRSLSRSRKGNVSRRPSVSCSTKGEERRRQSVAHSVRDASKRRSISFSNQHKERSKRSLSRSNRGSVSRRPSVSRYTQEESPRSPKRYNRGDLRRRTSASHSRHQRHMSPRGSRHRRFSNRESAHLSTPKSVHRTVSRGSRGTRSLPRSPIARRDDVSVSTTPSKSPRTSQISPRLLKTSLKAPDLMAESDTTRYPPRSSRKSPVGGNDRDFDNGTDKSLLSSLRSTKTVDLLLSPIIHGSPKKPGRHPRMRLGNANLASSQKFTRHTPRRTRSKSLDNSKLRTTGRASPTKTSQKTDLTSSKATRKSPRRTRSNSLDNSKLGRTTSQVSSVTTKTYRKKEATSSPTKCMRKAPRRTRSNSLDNSKLCKTKSKVSSGATSPNLKRKSPRRTRSKSLDNSKLDRTRSQASSATTKTFRKRDHDDFSTFSNWTSTAPIRPLSRTDREKGTGDLSSSYHLAQRRSIPNTDTKAMAVEPRSPTVRRRRIAHKDARERRRKKQDGVAQELKDFITNSPGRNNALQACV